VFDLYNFSLLSRIDKEYTVVSIVQIANEAQEAVGMAGPQVFPPLFLFYGDTCCDQGFEGGPRAVSWKGGGGNRKWGIHLVLVG
jgi:hypothetical protein